MIGVTQWDESTWESDLIPSSPNVAEHARNRLAENRTYAHYFQHVTCHYEQGVLTLRGRVPTDRLRETIVRLLSDLAGIDSIDSIDNQVDVISSTGLSCVHPK